MPHGSGAGLIRVPNVGDTFLINQATGNIAAAAATITMREARGFRNWTFQLDPNNTTVNATIAIFATIKSSEAGSLTSGSNPNPDNLNNWFQIGSWVVNGTGPFTPITYDKPLSGVFATIASYVSGTIDVLGNAVP